MAILFKTTQKSIPLIKDFVVPPFSYLDTRLGYWQDRRSMWLKYLGNLSDTRDGEYGRTFNIQKDTLPRQTSNFDPVLAELMYRWFTRNPVKVLDPFGGEQTKGIVAGVLGYEYWGMELRQEQVDVNQNCASEYSNVHYICGDSRKINDIITDRDFNFLITSPPYYDLEVYSGDDNDISTKESYKQFLNNLFAIFANCTSMMTNNAFAVIKVGEVRDEKTGAYYGFVNDTIDIMRQCGWSYYNEIILLNRVGSASVRAAGNMKSRKIVKLHQNILVFYKGDIDSIPIYYPELRTSYEND